MSDSTPAARRNFFKTSAAFAAGAVLAPAAGSETARADHLNGGGDPPFTISLAEWSLHKALFAGEMTNLDFPKVAKETYGIDAVEYVNQFFREEAGDEKYLAKLKEQCDDHGVTSVLIMVDGEGNLGDPDGGKRKQVVANHGKWLNAAKFLGCHAIRVNAGSSGSFTEQMRRAADGLHLLCEAADPLGLSVIVENHGGLSSNAGWLAGVMELADHPRVGTLPDFGNFRVADGDIYDPEKGLRILINYAKGVSAKSYNFPEGEPLVTTRPDWGIALDYPTLLEIVTDAGYHGRVGIEYEGNELSEHDGILRTKGMLEAVRDQLAA